MLKERRRSVNVASEIQTDLSKGEKSTEANGKYKRCPIAENETNNCRSRPIKGDELPTMSEGNGNSSVSLTEIGRTYTYGNFKRSLPQNTCNWSLLDLYDAYIDYYAELRGKTLKWDYFKEVQEEANDNQCTISELISKEKDKHLNAQVNINTLSTREEASLYIPKIPSEYEQEIAEVLYKESTITVEQLFVNDFQSSRFRIDVHREEELQMAPSKPPKGCCELFNSFYRRKKILSLPREKRQTVT